MDNQNDLGEFVRLMWEHKGIVYKICNSYCNNREDREDLAQEITYQLWRSGHTFRAGQKFSTWMYRVAPSLARICNHGWSKDYFLLTQVL
jgi:RNA polymerase sigma-70 factor (ECF subfamily)